MKYELTIKRMVVESGTVVIDAGSYEEAERKYFEPDYSKGERIIFDEEIEWNDDCAYDYEIVYYRTV